MVAFIYLFILFDEEALVYKFLPIECIIARFWPTHVVSCWYFACIWNNGPYTYTISYRPNIPVELVTTQLGFPTLDAWYDFSKELPIVYSDDSKAQIDCKASTANLTAWWMRWLLVFSPVKVMSQFEQTSLITSSILFP